jgi:hypothetical protein
VTVIKRFTGGGLHARRRVEIRFAHFQVDDVDALALQFMRLFEDIHDDKRGDVFGSFGNHGTLLEGMTKSEIRIFVLNTHGP